MNWRGVGLGLLFMAVGFGLCYLWSQVFDNRLFLVVAFFVPTLSTFVAGYFSRIKQILTGLMVGIIAYVGLLIIAHFSPSQTCNGQTCYSDPSTEAMGFVIIAIVLLIIPALSALGGFLASKTYK